MRIKILSIIVFLMLFPTYLFAGNLIWSYGWEDWGGTIATTPGYHSTNSSDEFCTDHKEATEAITTYSANEMSQTWLPKSGTYYLMQDSSPTYSMDPAVSGITLGHVNAHTHIGSEYSYCGGSTFNIADDITTGEIFIRVWARFNKGFYSIAGGGNMKWLRIYVDPDHNSDNTIFMHLTTKHGVSPTMLFACAG